MKTKSLSLSKIKLKKTFLTSISNPLSKKKLENFYKIKYFNENKSNFKKKYSKLEIKEKTYNFETYLFIIKKFYKKNNIDLLEVGCGEGFGAKYLYDKVNYFGTELTDIPIRTHNKKILNKINFFKGNFLEIKKIKKKFDVVILNGVLEHLIDLTKSINFLHSIIKKNGYIFIHVPNDFNICQRYYLRKYKIKDDRAPWVTYEHNHYFNKDSLNKIMIKKFKKVLIMGDFPIDLFLLNQKTNYYENKSFGKHAHDIRQKFNLLFRGNKLKMGTYIEFCIALCNLGLGRSLIGCFKKK